MTYVQQLQAALGLRTDGAFGPETYAATMRAMGKSVPEPKAALAPEPKSVPVGAMLYQGKARYPVEEIVVHCVATPPDFMAGVSTAERVAEVRRWHMRDRGWRDIGYHWLIDRDGTVTPGRAETEIGAGVEGHNAGVIHISLFGGFGSAETDPFERNFTATQDAALRRIIREVCDRTRIAKVTGHNQYAAKACPGFSVPDWLKA